MSFVVPAPMDVRDYAKSLGWQQLPEALADRLIVLNHPDIPRRQLVIPVEQSAPDYTEAVQRAMEKLAELHHLTVARVLSSIQSAREDIVRYRITSPRRDEDDVSLPFAASLLQGAAQMLQASACTVLKPQAHHPRLNRSQAEQVINSTRFGHTERGGFVLKMSCPVDALDTQIGLPFDSGVMPFVRSTTLTMQRALQTLVDAVEADTLERLEEQVKSEEAPLVSSNLCEAITRLHDEDMRNTVELSFSWAYGIPVPERYRRRDVIRIQSDYFARIEHLRRALRAQEGPLKDTFIGTVERLDGDRGEDGRRSGEVIVSLLLPEGDSVRAKLMLSPEQYEDAYKAHMTDGAYVRVKGKLHPGRQPRLFSDIGYFELLMP